MAERLPVGALPPAQASGDAPVPAADEVKTIKRRMDEIRAEEEARRKKVAE